MELTFGGKNAEREPEIIEVSEFIGVKSWKAKGKRVSNYDVKNILELEPTIKDDYDHHEEEPEEMQPVEEVEKAPDPADFDDIPMEVIKPKKEDGDDDADESSQMSLF